jgi:hypothetical protein
MTNPTEIEAAEVIAEGPLTFVKSVSRIKLKRCPIKRFAETSFAESLGSLATILGRTSSRSVPRATPALMDLKAEAAQRRVQAGSSFNIRRRRHGNILAVPISDTSPSAQALQLQIQRAMSGEQRLLLALEMSLFARELARERIRRESPEWSDAQVARELFRLTFLPAPAPARLR